MNLFNGFFCNRLLNSRYAAPNGPIDVIVYNV